MCLLQLSLRQQQKMDATFIFTNTTTVPLDQSLQVTLQGKISTLKLVACPVKASRCSVAAGLNQRSVGSREFTTKPVSIHNLATIIRVLIAECMF